VKNLEKKLDNAKSYDEWRELALEHDRNSGREHWKKVDKTGLYDYASIRSRIERLRYFRENNDNIGLLFTLNEGIHGNMGGMGKPVLYSRAKFGTKQLIHSYVDEITDALDHLAQLDVESPGFVERLDFFRRASKCYGRSALMLSGGAILGNFHVGVVKSLLEQGLLPDVISGASAGSLIAGVLGTRTDEELRYFLDPDHLRKELVQEVDMVKNGLANGRPRINHRMLKEKIAKLIPDMTFQEAYEKTGRHINISVSPSDVHQTSRLLNAIASPNVYIRKAVLASCAVPGVFPPVMLEAKNVHGHPQPYLATRRWIDGSVSDDLPAKRLARMYGVNHFIVSQTNPLVLWMVRDHKADNFGLINSVRHVSMKTMKECVMMGNNLVQRYFKGSPSVRRLANMTKALVSQEYTGDVNIIPRYRFFDPRKLLHEITEEQLMYLIGEGEHATWPKIEMIRTSTKISRKLAEILDAYELEELNRLGKSHHLGADMPQRKARSA
jgi:TAG lipase / steryl ester hydrolase / phospholipase A2 / LPA acyltransferase